jgi:hypothetical protein
MNKNVTPKQLELTAGKTREELLLAAAPHIDPESPALKADMAKMDKIEKEEAARAVVGLDAPEEISLLLKQSEITIAHDETLGEWIIRQKNWPDDDDEIRIIDERMSGFIDNLTREIGIPSFP